MTTIDQGTDSGAGAPTLAGIHHLKLPVSDLAASKAFYAAALAPL